MLKTLLLATLVLASACTFDAHPEYRASYAVMGTSGPQFLLLDYAEQRYSDGGVRRSGGGLRTVDVATGEVSARQASGLIRENCAPAGVGRAWCTGEPDPLQYRTQLRRLSDLSIEAGRDHLINASEGRLQPSDFYTTGLDILPGSHEVVLRQQMRRADDNLFWAVSPEGLEFRQVDWDPDAQIDEDEGRDWAITYGCVGAACFDFHDDGGLYRSESGGPEDRLDPERVWSRPALIQADPFDARGQALSVDAPRSIFVLELTDSRFRISRVRTDDGVPVWTHEDARSYTAASAISNGVLGLVRVYPYEPEPDDPTEREAEVVGLDVETGAELYRQLIPDVR